MSTRLTFSVIRYFFSLLLCLVVGGGIFIYWAVGGSLPTRTGLPIKHLYEGNVPQPKRALKVVSYNIGHCQGVKENAWDYRDKETTKRQLDRVANAMVKMDADIFLLQEVDLDSKRTYHINQIDFIKEKTKHPYHVCATVWEKNYIPFPYWPPAHHLGYVRSANCILSRFPLQNHERIIFEKPKSNPFWYNWAYIDRGIQRADVQIGDQKIALLNIHLEAWETKAREDQIKIVNSYINEIDIPVILGGDFNTILPDATIRTGFLDDPDVDYGEDQTLAWFFKNAASLQIPKLSEKSDDPFKLYTFPSSEPDRRLDHIFLLGDTLSFSQFFVEDRASTASDHLPVVAKIKMD